jgi:hypothetical protein
VAAAVDVRLTRPSAVAPWDQMACTPSIHPRDACRPTRSEAEKEVWKALHDRLPSGWCAWHSLRIRDPNAILGEGDFVLAHPQRGFLVLEVKGGRIERRDGRWVQNGKTLDPAPLDQGVKFAKRLARRLGDFDCAAPAYGAAVCFPDTDFEKGPGGDDCESVVLGRRQLEWLGEALPGVVERALPPPQVARGAWVERLHALWGETWIPGLELGRRAREVDESRLQLDADQVDALEDVIASDRSLVRGRAGSGKTLIAAEAARRAAARGQKVLFLCFTQPLRTWLASRLAGDGIQVQTVSGFAKRVVDGHDGPTGVDPLDQDYWKRISLRAAELAARDWDVVIVDEAQDLMLEAWLLVSTLADGKRLWAFHDPGQGYWPDRTPPRDLFGSARTLPRGRRCPAGVEALAQKLLGLPFDAEAFAQAKQDGTLGFVPCPSLSSVPDKVAAEVDRLVATSVPLEDIAIVSLRGQTAADAIFQRPAVGKHAIVHADHPEMEQRLVADSFLRWKGLERPVVIVTDLQEPGVRQHGVRANIALTRALVAARLVGPRAMAESYGF